MKQLLIFLFLVNQSAFAGTIFKCKDAKGSVIFQQTACATGQETGVQSFQRVPDAPTPLPSEGREAVSDNGRDLGQATAAPPPSTQRSKSVAGYLCSDDRSEWVQPNPCPASTGNVVAIVNGVMQAVPVLVKQQELSSSEMCEQLLNNPATANKGKGADSTYERNKLRDANGC